MTAEARFTTPASSETPSSASPNAATLQHLVALLEIVDGCGLSRSAHCLAAEAIRELVFTAPRVRPLYEQLQTLARDAGYATDRVGLLNGHTTHRELEALLADPDWRDPADVLDPTGEVGLDYASLIAATRARIRRGDGPTRKLMSVLDRLCHARDAQATAPRNRSNRPCSPRPNRP